jgi:DNA-binding winged helix-turn-helix (wHTH) protein/TolB-like protein
MGTGSDVGQLRFGRFAFDVEAGELYRDGLRLRLQEQPRQVLAILLERPNQIVTREELRQRLWRNETFVDFDHSLNTAIKKVRQALGDSAGNPRFIETLAKRGYRFIAPVHGRLAEPNVTSAVPPLINVPEPMADPARPWRANRLFLSGVLVTGLALAAIWLVRSGSNPTSGMKSTVRPRAQLAVLPLNVLTSKGGGQPDAYVGVGVADAIITRLANVHQIALRPTAAVLPYGTEGIDPTRVGEALAVEHLLVGTIQPSPATYRVTVQLVRARDAVAIWGGAYDIPRQNLLQLQDTVAEQIVRALRLQLTAGESERMRRRYTENSEAYDWYLRGRALLANYTDANMREAINSFEEALKIDPHYALARSGLATACAWFSVRFAYETEAAAWGKRAEDEAQKALAEDSMLADAHLAIAQSAGTLYRGFDWNALLDESAKALRLDPSLELAHVARMRALYHLGLFDVALRENERVRALNPTPNIESARVAVATELFAGKYVRARDEATMLLARTDAPAVRMYLGLAQYYLGELKGAEGMLASAQRGGHADVRSQAALAAIEAAAGNQGAAVKRIESIRRGPYMDHHIAYSLAAAFAQLGDATESIAWLQRSADTGFPCYPWFDSDPLLRPLRTDKRFTTLMSNLRQQYADVHARYAIETTK